MSEKKYIEFGSRFAFNNKHPSKHCRNERSDRSKPQVELNYYVLELSPRNTKHLKPGEKQGTSTINNDSSVRNGEKEKEVGARTSPTDTDSNESFYSCYSSTSLQEANSAKPKDKTEPAKTKPSSGQLGNEKNTAIREDELLNQLTMVNAIFLRNNWNECTQGEHSANNQQQNTFHGCMGKETLKTLNTPGSSKLFYSEAFTCQIERNTGVKFINKIYEDNITATPFTSNQNALYFKPDRECRWPWETFDGKVKVSKPCQFIGTKSGHEGFVEDFSSKDNKFEENLLTKNTPSKFMFRRRKTTTLRPSIYKKFEMKQPKMRFAKLVSDESDVPIALEKNKHKSKLIKRKFEVSEGHEVKFLEPKQMKNDSIVVSPENEESNFKSRYVSCGDGNQVKEQKSSLINNAKPRSQSISLINDIDEPYLRTLINQSIKKIQNESRKRKCTEGAQTEDDAFSDSNEDESFFDNQEDDMINEIGSKISNMALTQSMIDVSTAHPEPYSNNSDTRTAPKNINPKYKRTPISTTVKDKKNYNPDLVTQTRRCCSRRTHCQRKNFLPVIEEESLESLLSEVSEDDQEEEYCLVDNNGRPIYLFDYQGLPLTDGCGRPLRLANGKLLIKCDKNGIPMVDYDEYPVFDMFGRHPHEDKFDPSMAPKMPVCNKLLTSDGKPLMLYDVEGRPLTSVSGTMLVDSSGRGLVRITNNVGV